jgi:pimeloyl-ACP methyl ester carboxylesterase
MSRVGEPGASIAYDAIGDGMPLLAIHGAYSARAEVRGFLEPMVAGRALRRIYVDLPGHGESRPSDGLQSPDDVLDVIDLVLDAEAPDGPFLLLGHSFGCHFARTVAARHPDRLAGLALICPMMPGEPEPARFVVVRDDGVGGELDAEQRATFEEYFTIRTAQTLEAFRTAVAPAIGPADDTTLDRAITTEAPRRDPDEELVEAPVAILTARHDHYVGWRRQQSLIDTYPHATATVVADAGHALPHEHPALVAALLHDWLDRAGIATA